MKIRTFDIVIAILAILVTLLFVDFHDANAWDQLPDRNAWFQSPTISKMIEEQAARGRRIRQADPTAVPVIQAWGNLSTGVWNLYLTIGHSVEFGDRISWNFVILTDGVPTTYEFRAKTGHECMMSLYLSDYEWFHGRGGDI